MFLRKKNVRLEIRNERLRDQLAVLISSIEGFLVQSAHDTMPADLLILEIGDDTVKDFDALTRAKATGRAGEFFITSKSTNPDVLIQALRIGVKEFIPQPLNEGEVRKALLRFRDGSEPTPAAPRGPGEKGKSSTSWASRAASGRRRSPSTWPTASCASTGRLRWPSST